MQILLVSVTSLSHTHTYSACSVHPPALSSVQMQTDMRLEMLDTPPAVNLATVNIQRLAMGSRRGHTRF